MTSSVRRRGDLTARISAARSFKLCTFIASPSWRNLCRDQGHKLPDGGQRFTEADLLIRGGEGTPAARNPQYSVAQSLSVARRSNMPAK